MATYAELIQASGNSTLQDRVMVACVVAADAIRAKASPTAGERSWASMVFMDPPNAMREVLWSVLAQNKAATLAQIVGATDAQVQTAVDAAVPLLTA